MYLINCKKCKVQYIGSTTTRFRAQFNNHKSRVNAQRGKDELIYQYFNTSGHRSWEAVTIRLVDHVKGEEELREKERESMYKLVTMTPHGLNDNDSFYAQNKKLCTVTQCANNILLVACA